MYIVITAYLFILGACLGSFSGAMAWRIKHGRNVLRERSECESCHHVLVWYDLVPVVSWLGLRGKCRHCNASIGWTAFVLEIGLGICFALSYLVWPYGLSSGAEWLYLILWLVALVMLTILFVYDTRHFLLPDIIVWPLVVVGVLMFGIRALSLHWGAAQSLIELIVAFIPITGVYWVLYIVSGGKWIGFGDVKLGLFIGLALGWQSALLVLLLANFLGCLWIIPGMLTGRIKANTRIPFGPFLITATYIAILWGETLIHYYQSLFII